MTSRTASRVSGGGRVMVCVAERLSPTAGAMAAASGGRRRRRGRGRGRGRGVVRWAEEKLLGEWSRWAQRWLAVVREREERVIKGGRREQCQDVEDASGFYGPVWQELNF